jgi:hypothetical protein
VAADVVTDPYSPAGETHQIKILRSIRDDPLAGLMSRRVIDAAQFEAGRRWQLLHDISGIGALRAIDPFKEPVDGRGALGFGPSDRAIDAATGLRRAAEHLGSVGAELAHLVLVEGLTLAAVAERRGVKPTEDVTRYFGRRFREVLESLARLWGFAS